MTDRQGANNVHYDVEDLRGRLLDDIERLVLKLLPNGHRDKTEWKAGDISGAPGGSLGVALTGQQVGLWHDRATQEGGDIFGLIAASQKIRAFPDVLKWSAEWLGETGIEHLGQPTRHSARAAAPLEPITPIPETAGKVPDHPRFGRPSMRWAYRDADGGVVMIVNRFERPPEGKEFRPQIYALGPTGRGEWLWQAMPTPRPMYAIDQLTARLDDPILIVEGEKTADAAQGLLPGYVVMTWPGGAGGVGHFDPSPLAGRDVTIWPDADDAGRGAADAVAKRVVDAGAADVRIVDLPDGLPKGWDLADPMPDGMGIDDVVRLIDTAREWQPDPPPVEPEPAVDDGNPAPDDVDATIAHLAGLSLPAYDRERKPAAERLGLRAPILDKLVAAARPEDVRDERTGRPLRPKEIEPWQDEVDGAAMFGELSAEFSAYIIMSHAAADMCALWAVHTHVIDGCHYTPRLFITSPDKRCGKTQLLKIVSKAVVRPLNAGNISSASFFRAVQAIHPTLMVDEFDAHSKDDEDMRSVVNNGYERGNPAVRCDPNTLEPLEFDTFAPCAVAAIGRVWATVEEGVGLVWQT